MRLWQNWQHYSVGALECSARKVKCCPEGSFPQFSKERLSNAFKSYEHTVIKILSHRVPNTTKLTLEKLFQEQNQYDAKLVNLVRDPRGVVYSRVKLGWMKTNFNSPEFQVFKTYLIQCYRIYDLVCFLAYLGLEIALKLFAMKILWRIWCKCYTWPL